MSPARQPLSPGTPAGQVLLTYVRQQVARLLAEEPRVRADEEDAVHQMRVASRRLRSTLRTFGALVDDAWARSRREELAWLAGSLSQARDLEVLGGRISSGLDALDPAQVRGNARTRAERFLATRAEQARAAVEETLCSARYASLRDLLGADTAGLTLTPEAERPAAEVLPGLVQREWRRLARRARRLVDTQADAVDYHRARIAAKHLRYAAEAVAPALEGKPVRLAKRAEALQDLLGEHQDAVVAAGALAELGTGRGAGTAAFTFGVLHARELAAADQARVEFPDAWRRASRGKARRWMKR